MRAHERVAEIAERLARDEELDGDGDGDGGEGEGVVEEVSLLMPFSTFPFGCFLACLFERGESDKV